MARIALLAGGGGAPGVGEALRSAGAAAAAAGGSVLGVRRGFLGLHEGDAAPLAPGSPGGGLLEGAPFPALREPAAAARCAERLRAMGADGLVVAGGEGSLQGALALARAGARVVHLPAAVENDVAGTDVSLGVDSAVNAILLLVERAEGPVVMEVPGRLTGYLALVGAAAAGAAGALLVERPFPWDRLPERLAAGVRPVLLCSEGGGAAGDAAARLGRLVEGAAPAAVSLGGPLRGARPSFFDRVLAGRLGEAAAEALLGGVGGRMIAWRGGRCEPVPLEEAAGRRRQVAPEVFEFAKRMGVLYE